MFVRWENKFHEACWEEDNHQAGVCRSSTSHLLVTDSSTEHKRHGLSWELYQGPEGVTKGLTVVRVVFSNSINNCNS